MDISYIRTSEEWLYPAIVADFYFRRIAGRATDNAIVETVPSLSQGKTKVV